MSIMKHETEQHAGDRHEGSGDRRRVRKPRPAISPAWKEYIRAVIGAANLSRLEGD